MSRRGEKDTELSASEPEDEPGSGARRSSVTVAFVEHQTFLKKFLTRFFVDSSDIDDVAQETYLRAYAAEKKKDIAQPKAFLFRIARNVALNELTKKSRQITDYIEEAGEPLVPDPSPSADDEAEADELLGLYCEAVAGLPEKARQAFLLRKVHGLSHKAIAQRMNLSVSSVEKYLIKGILACKTYLKNHEGVPEKGRAGAPRRRIRHE